MVHFSSGAKNQQQQPQRPPSGGSGGNGSGGDKDLTGNLELGELGQLTITNDNESSYDVRFSQDLKANCFRVKIT